MLLITAAAERATPELSAAAAVLVTAFSPFALSCATLVAASGLALAWLHVGAVDALVASGYGRTLLVKLALVAVVAALGAWHWRRVRPALGEESSARRVRRTSAVELLVAALALVVTAVLVATPPPTDLLR